MPTIPTMTRCPPCSAAWVLLLLALPVLAACSRISVVYETADFFIEQYARDYLSLGNAQMAAWRPALTDALARHRQEELPYLAAAFESAYRASRQGFDAPTMQCLIDRFEEVYRRHVRLAADLAAPLLANLTPEGIRALDRKFRAESAKDAAEANAATVGRHERKRAKRYRESAEWWVGPLTEPQRAIIGTVTAAMPDTAADWVAYRGAKRDMLILLLERQAGEVKIRRYLHDWLAEFTDLPPSLQRAHLSLRERIQDLFVRMDKSFSPKQRAHFAARLAGLRDDFLRLQKQPRMATVGCTAPG